MPDLARLPHPLVVLLQRFADRAQVPEGADREVADAAVAAYFDKHPIPESLKRDFGTRYRETLANLDVAGLSQAALQLTGEDPIAKTKAAPGAGPRGALAYFAARSAVDGDDG